MKSIFFWNLDSPGSKLLIDGLKLENEILKEVVSNESDVFALLSTISFPRIPI